MSKFRELNAVDHKTQLFSSSAGGNAINETPHVPPLRSGSATNLTDDMSSPGADLLYNLPSMTNSDTLELTRDLDLLNSVDVTKSGITPTHQTGSVNNWEGQSMLDEKDPGRKIIYVKRKRNQLIAALGTGGAAAPFVDKTQASSASGYYKRRKNQLVRTSLENHVEENVVAANGFQSEAGTRGKKFAGNAKTRKPLTSSVWRLHDTKSDKSNAHSVRSHKVWPHLFPWKRATYLRNSLGTVNGSSLSLLSQKLLLSRSRATVYTRSTNGFSLRRFKVLSVGGSNLKWSKSIEGNSKKADVEGTLAVAADERSKKEQKMTSSAVLQRKNHVSRERIFHIGSQRYKMDPSRKTLHRISNDEDKLQLAPQAEVQQKKSYVPRRLFFGNDEYVRIGNGSQLVRDPKKRTRTLASEKVRWSLHTARLRLAKKKKYCQFFTRFGQCNKDDGKCPYIHDPSKIAVCTKFLNGSCSNLKCKLTHEVIPERMPDCSYFLQGLCSNENCPYRHVSVNPRASLCEGFLKGYCANGNECQKKHTYVCPVFEVTGECVQGSRCKLHHPKKKIGTRKPLREQKKAQGRYFGSSDIDITDWRVTEKLSEKGKGNDIFCEDGRIANYISLDVGDEQVEHTIDLINEQTSDRGPSDAQVSPLDELIKPVRLMSKYSTLDATPATKSQVPPSQRN